MMRKKLNIFGIVLIVMAIFTGCQKDEELSVVPNDENVAQLIDNDQALLILNEELTKLETNRNNSSVLECKSTEEYYCDLFKLILEYDEDPDVDLASISVYSNKYYYDPGNPDLNYISQVWLYKENNWNLKSTRLLGGAISINEFLGQTHFTDWNNNEGIAVQVILYQYRAGEQPEYTGITDGIFLYLSK